MSLWNEVNIGSSLCLEILLAYIWAPSPSLNFVYQKENALEGKRLGLYLWWK